MQGNMKKVAVFVVAAALTMFISVAAALAFDHEWKRIHGEYGFAGGGICIATPFTNIKDPKASNPFNPSNLIEPTKVTASSFHSHGVLNFKKDGKGTIDLYAVGSTLYTITMLPSWGANYAHVTYPFTYTISDDGEMTWAAVTDTVKQEVLDPVTGVPTGLIIYRDHYSLKGWVSGDHKTITLATPAPEVDTTTIAGATTPLQKIICHESHTLTRLDE